jgi:hypothetical protein
MNIRVSMAGIMRRTKNKRKGMVGFDRMRENGQGREENPKLQGQNLHDI